MCMNATINDWDVELWPVGSTLTGFNAQSITAPSTCMILHVFQKGII